MTHTQKQLFSLLKTSAYAEGRFTLSSGKKSTYYIDCRRVTLTSRGAYWTGRAILEALRGTRIDAIGGPTIGADPIVTAVSVVRLIRNKKPLKAFLVRKTAKAHGTQRQLEGPTLQRGSRVVIVDDVATTGGSLIDSVQCVRKAGLRVVKVMVLVDRAEGAAARLKKIRCPFRALFHIDEFKSQKHK